jgi:RNA polymerase sigma-70 factor (ECF subfamily)
VGAGYEDDEVLVAALRRRDEDAFAWLLDHYDGPLRRMARTFVATGADADEMVAETWLGVIKGIDRFEGRSSLKTWLFQILINQARTRGAREKRSVPFASLGPTELSSEASDLGFSPDRFRTGTEPYPGHWSTPPDRWRPDEQAERSELQRIILDAIAKLPDVQRQVITLRDVDGWSSEEVCNVLDLTATNQRVILHRARAKVREALDRRLKEVDA